MMNINNKTSKKEVIDVEENPSYDENKVNTIEVVGSDDHYENNGIISNENSDNNNEQMYPSDCYSFLSLYGPIKTPGIYYFSLSFYWMLFVHHTLLRLLIYCCFVSCLYSFFLFLSSNPITAYFVFGLVICLFQLAFLILFVLSVLYKKFSSKGDVDSK